MGCKRILPADLMTGDHIIPKSQKDRLRAKIAQEWDELDMALYYRAINAGRSRIRKTRLGDDLRIIQNYDANLSRDLRNIQPMCALCNSKKGDRPNIIRGRSNSIS